MRAEGYSVSSGGWGWDILGFRFGGVWCIVRHPNLVCATEHQSSASLTAVLMPAAWESFFMTACLNGTSPDVTRAVIYDIMHSPLFSYTCSSSVVGVLTYNRTRCSIFP